MSAARRTLNVDVLARVEGEGAMYLRIRDGQIDDVRLRIYEPPRFFEAFLRGRGYREPVDITARICGICPIDKRQLLEVISAHLHRRAPRVRGHSVCIDCKRRGTVCVMVAHGTACLGPVTHTGCGALCPAYDRGCYGCYGPMETPNTTALSDRMAELGAGEGDLVRVYRTFNAGAEAFREESVTRERG